MSKQRSAAEAIASYPTEYTAAHYPKGRDEVAALRDELASAGRRLVSAHGEPLERLDAIRLALRLDGEVWSRS